MLLLVAAIWGSGFTLSKNALSCTNPMTFALFRFGTAFLFLCILYLIQDKKLPFKAWKSGIFSGVFLFVAILLQTIALRYTTASRAAFIAGLNCIIVPFLFALQNRKFPPKTVFFGALFSAAGLIFLCNDIGNVWNRGDTIAVFSAALFAIQILSVSKESAEASPREFVFSEIGSCALLALFAAHFLGERNTDFSAFAFWSGALLTGIFCTTGAFFIQGKFQKETSATKAAVIFATEPAFGLLFSLIVPNTLGEVEILRASQLAGCLFLFLGIIVSEFASENKKMSRNT